MKNLLLSIILCSSGFLLAQTDIKKSDSSFTHISHETLTDQLPQISQDSTKAELITHVTAMIDWMEKEHFKYNYAPPLIYADTGLYLAEKSGDEQLLHKTRSVLGNIMLRVKDTAKAKQLFLKSLTDAKAAADSTVILASSGNLANAYYYTHGYNHKAIQAYLDGIEIAKKLRDTTRIFIMHHNVARIFLENEDVPNSAFHIDQSDTYLKNIDNKYYRSSHLRNQGMLLLLQGNTDPAIEKFKKNIALAEEVEFMDGLIEGHEGYIKALKIKGDYKGVYEIAQKLQAYKDAKADEDATQTIDAVTAKINVERYKEQLKSKELEKQLAQQKASRKNILLLIIMCVAVFLIILLFVIYQSHTKRKKLVADLRKKNKQYLKAKEKSEEMSKTKANFFSTVSHELRTPLYGVIGLSTILLEDKSLKSHEKDLKSLKFSADYLLSLINDVLQINKIDSNNINKEKVDFDIRELINTIITSFSYVIEQNNNKAQVIIGKDIPQYINGNSVILSQILMNLVGNAAKFTENGSIKITVQTTSKEADKQTLRFSIKDTGIGIPKEKQEQIFNEFSQIHAKKYYDQGTGLGLPIVKKLLLAADSDIHIISEEGEGSEFYFHLEFTEARPLVEKPPIALFDKSHLKNKRILVVDDNKINQKITEKILNNHDVITAMASNGEEAVKKVKENSFDLVLMDLNMPVLNGFDATKKIRKFDTAIPIIALTAVEVDEVYSKIFDSGMNDIIVKPYDVQRFLDCIYKNLISITEPNRVAQ